MRNFVFKLIRILQLSFLPLLLAFISVVLIWKSYTPNTFLTGWDTLHPEFNFKHAFTSIVFGVWRTDQGLGAIAAHSHMSELPRLLYLWISSLLIPLQLLRYSFVFLTLIFGPLGMYFALNTLLKEKTNSAKRLAACVGAAYYLLNLGTVQRFAVPFEMFTTQFAVLPWIFLFAFSFLETGKRNFLVWFAITSFLGASQAYAATLFYAYALLFVLSLVSYKVLHHATALKKVMLIVVTLFVANAFWILPNLYSVRNQSTEISNSKINQLFTPEALLHNQSWGSFENIISHKNYLFGWQAYDFQTSKFTDLLGNWNAYLLDPRIAIIPFIFAVLALIGIVVSLFARRKLSLSLLVPTLFSLFFLMNTNGPLGGLYTYLQAHSGLFSEGFRDTFTKFSTLLSFFMAFYIAQGLSFMFENTRKIKVRALVIVPMSITIVFISLLGILMRPAFETGLISPLMRVSIPQEYFDTFHWFKGKSGRVAQLPLNSMWGWQYNSWGYQGAGFFWFGIDNAYVTRDFDRWSSENETLYHELGRAFNASDIETFDAVLEKYTIRYLLLDGSIFNPGQEHDAPLADNVKQFLSKSKRIAEVAQFGFISVYETPYSAELARAPQVYSKVNSLGSYAAVDYPYAQYGTYVTDTSGVWKPFVNFDRRNGLPQKEEDWMTVVARSSALSDMQITIPDMVQREGVLPISLSINKTPTKVTMRFDLIQPKIALDGKALESEPVYLTTSLASNTSVGYLTVENTIFDIATLPVDSEFHTIGETYVTTDGKTKVALFQKSEQTNRSFLKEISSKKASWCSDASHELDLDRLPNGFSLNAEDQSVCVGSLVTLNTPAIYETSFVSPTASSSLFCLNKVGQDGCVNVLPPSATSLFGGRKILYTTPLEAGEYWFAFVGQSVPNVKTTSTYDDLQLGYYPQISQTQLEFGVAYGLFSTEKNISIPKLSTIAVSYFAKPVISEDFILERGHPKAVNCDLSQKGSVSKQFEDGSVIYEATLGGISCDYFDFPQLLQTQAYVLNIEGKNSEGRSIKFYLQNKHTSFMDMEELLPKGTFSENYIIEPYKQGIGGYVLNFETRSLDQIASKNTLSKISFAPVPLKWLTEITVGPKTEIVVNNKLSIVNTRSFGPVTQVETTGEGVLAFNQAYEKGWIAITNRLAILNHNTVNGWENGWNVPADTSSISIFYVPQLLELLGFSLLPLLTYRLTKRA